MYNCQQLVRCWYWSNILSPRSYAFANVMLTILCQTMSWATVNPTLFMKSIQHDLTEMAIRKSEVWFIKFDAPGFVLLLIVVYTRGRAYSIRSQKSGFYFVDQILMSLSRLWFNLITYGQRHQVFFFGVRLQLVYSICLLIWERCLFKNECKF